MSSITTRIAEASDLEQLVQMLADDMLGQSRESLEQPLSPRYRAAFEAIEADPNNELLVAVMDGVVVAFLQLTYTPSLSYQGSWRATLESVRTRSDLRGRGIGAALVRAAVERARERGCGSVQLTTHAKRTDAQRFYQRLGFTASHVGMKLMLPQER